MFSQKFLKLAIQKSGRLSDETFELLQKSGFDFETNTRSLSAKCRNFPLELLFLRAGDIPEIVADGMADIGICGQNSIAERNLELEELQKLGFGNCRLSIAVPENFSGDLSGKRIATSFSQILKNFLDTKKISAEIVELSGSVEIAPNLGIADAVCDLVSTGSTLRINGLRELEPVFFSEAVCVANKEFPVEKSEILKKFLMRIRAVILAKKFKYIVFNLERKNLPKIAEILPGLESPTISSLADGKWVSVATVAAENDFWETIEKLKRVGASGILVQPIEKMIL